MRAVIFAGGSITDYDYTASLLRDGDMIVAADSGYDHVRHMGLTPDVVIGDMDSVKNEPVAAQIIRLNVMKDDTDTEAAVSAAVERGADELLILGAIGSRADHSLANILLLKKLDDMGVKACIANEHNEIYFMRDTITLSGKCGDLVSVLPLCELIGVTNTGLLYALSGETLHFGAARGVSNVMTQSECTISALSGCAIVTKSRD